jgi:oligoendopeptidase F
MLALLYSPDRDLRERAFRTFLQHHGRNSLVLTAIFNALILDHRVEDDFRGYRGPMHRTHLENEIRPETVELMMGVTENHYSLAQEYFQIKSCLLGLPKLKNCDLFAPLPGAPREMSFEEAKSLLLKSFTRFHPLFGRIAGEFFERRWVDAEIRKGKYGGAFCSGLTPSLHPYLLLNFTGNLRDALTLAHEMGHGIHFYLARKQGFLNFDPTLTLAETASVFGEMIMVQALLEEKGNLEIRQALLCTEIEDIIATVFRQNVLTRFEQKAHGRRRDHLLSGEEIGDLWWQENEKLFGKTVEMLPEYRWGWSYISHFIHSRFYCYSYIFGELVVLTLYEKYLEEGESFIPAFIRLLESGGSGSPDELLSRMGLDINRADFWERGFKVLRNLLDELKSLGPWDKICVSGDL